MRKLKMMLCVMPDSTYQALSSLLFVFLESHHKIDKSQAAKNDV